MHWVLVFAFYNVYRIIDGVSVGSVWFLYGFGWNGAGLIPTLFMSVSTQRMVLLLYATVELKWDKGSTQRSLLT